MKLFVWLSLAALHCVSVFGQTPTLGLSDGFISLSTSQFTIQLVKDSQTLYSLKPKNSPSNFDFIPSDKMTQRQYNGNYHLGDITFRARPAGSSSWISGDSSTARRPVNTLSASGSTLAAADLTPTLPSNSPLSITRRWVLSNGTLQLLFDVKNTKNVSIEIGSLGAPLEFNNVSSYLYGTRSSMSNLSEPSRSSQTETPQTPTISAVCSIHILGKMQVMYKSPLYWARSLRWWLCRQASLPSRVGASCLKTQVHRPDISPKPSKVCTSGSSTHSLTHRTNGRASLLGMLPHPSLSPRAKLAHTDCSSFWLHLSEASRVLYKALSGLSPLDFLATSCRRTRPPSSSSATTPPYSLHPSRPQAHFRLAPTLTPSPMRGLDTM